MVKAKSPKHIIDHLEILEKNTKIITINLNDSVNRNLLNEYIKEHKKPNGKAIARGSFNDFLKQHDKFKKSCKDKIVVAEITAQAKGRLKNIGAGLGYNPKDPYSDYNLDIDGGDFTGSRFNRVEFYDMNDVSLRDTVLDRVRIVESTFLNIDLRGSNFYKCEFFSDKNLHSLENIQLGLANPNAVQDKGMFVIEHGTAIAISIGNIKQTIAQKQSDEIKKAIKEYLEKQSGQQYRVIKFLKSFVTQINPEDWGKTLTKEMLQPELQDIISSIEEKYEQIEREEISKARKKHCTRFENPVLDPTYTPNQSLERAVAVKVILKATKEDLLEYSKSNKVISFNDFIAKKYSQKLNGIKNENPNKMIIPVATFEKENLSGMNLSGLDLSRVNFSYCNMSKCVLVKANLNGSCLEGANLTEANLQEAKLIDCNMVGITAQNANLRGAIMIRAQVNCADLKDAHMENAIGYRSVFMGSDMERVDMRRADMRRSNLEGVNLRYVDARYAQLQKANLSRAVADHAKLAHANLSKSIANNFRAHSANLEHVVMNEMQAHFADLRKANLFKVQAKGADFSDADLKEIQAEHADFEKAILNRADASLAHLERAILTEVQAQEVNFTNAVLTKIEAERIDIRKAVLANADLQRANLQAAIMEDVDARKADFRNAFLQKANLQRGNFVGTDFRGAKLIRANVKGAVLMAANLEKANVSHIKTDPATILIDANLRGIIGDKETVAALKARQKEQHKLQAQWFGRSKYGHCAANADGSNDRFRCQRLGAMVLSTALGGGAGITLAGPLAGVSAATLTALISDKVLRSTQEHYFSDLGYINNSLGDRLAEVGAVALSMGVGTTDLAIDGAVAGLVCSFAGVVQGAALSVVGVGTVLGGLKLAIDGVREQSRWKKFTGMFLSGVGAVTSFFGISSLGTSLNTIAYGAAIGGITGGLWAGASAVKRLYEYSEDTPDVGVRPEHIYRESIERAKGIWRKIVPTMKKIMVGLALATIATVTAVAVTNALPLIGAITIVKAAVVTNVAITAATGGFFVGYLYDDKIIPIKQSGEIEKSKQEAQEVLDITSAKIKTHGLKPKQQQKSHITHVRKSKKSSFVGKEKQRRRELMSGGSVEK